MEHKQKRHKSSRMECLIKLHNKELQKNQNKQKLFSLRVARNIQKIHKRSYFYKENGRKCNSTL